MDDIRNLVFNNNILTFPCGVKVEVQEKKLRWLFNLMKLNKEIEQIISVGNVSIPKGPALQLKNYLEKN